jgi:hypothetical protein
MKSNDPIQRHDVRVDVVEDFRLAGLLVEQNPGRPGKRLTIALMLRDTLDNVFDQMMLATYPPR